MSSSKKLESVEHSISENKVKNGAMRKIIESRRLEVAEAEKYSRRLGRTIEILRHNGDKFLNDLETTKKAISQVTSRLKLSDSERSKIRCEIKEATQKSIMQLKDHIFPFHCENSYITSTTTNSVDTTYSESEGPLFISESGTESFSTTCCPPSMGSWANVESNCTRYLIVEPWIPRDSIARAYCHWLDKMKDPIKLSPIGETDGLDGKIRENDSYRVSAALSYITQLLSVASYYMDARFPKRLNFVEFYSKCSDSGPEIFLTDEEILHKVAKLNANLIYLCLSQRVDPRYLEPTYTGHNLTLLLNPNFSNLDQAGPIYIDSETHRRVEESLYPDYILVEPSESQDFSEADDIFDEECIGNDWESVTSSNTTPYVDLFTSQQTTSMTGGIMSSIAETALYAVTSFIRKK
ncbi:beclin 1-associated autophagy-related key regulator [Tetranychus urticae]|uniref:Beclin 1-associated autophagy-related key regulator n=1 Tax=Tetranychus urticae TaxID=32264 RepID=T1KTS3_TETUR|nr:beclin 1-associated autophagy-related key regulator [Tetranychus urticae]